MLETTDRVLYTAERLEKLAREAASSDSVFSLNDCIGLVNDAMALAKAGLSKISSAMTLIDHLQNNEDCERRPQQHLCIPITPSGILWNSISNSLTTLVSTWWGNTDIVRDLNLFRQVCFNHRNSEELAGS